MAADCPFLEEYFDDLLSDLDLEKNRFDEDIKEQIIVKLKNDWNARHAGTGVKKCRFANWVDRAPEYDQSLTFTNIRILYYGKQENLFSEESLTRLRTTSAAAKKSEESDQLERANMANSNDPVKKLREANHSNVHLTAILLADPLCRPRLRLLSTLCSPIRQWYGFQSKGLRSTHEHRAFIQKQVGEHFAEPLRLTWKQLCDGAVLSHIGVECDLNPTLMQCHRDHPLVAHDDALAHTCGAYVTALVAHRSKRLLYLTHGWTGQQARFTSDDVEVRQAAADQLMQQHRAFEQAKLRREPFWQKVVKRSIFNHVPTQQLVEFLRLNNGEVSDGMRAHCEHRISGIGQSKISEDQVGVGRGREHTAHNKSQILARRLWESYIDRQVASKLYRYEEPEWPKMPLPAGPEGQLPKSLFTTQFKDVPKWIPKIIGTGRQATDWFSTSVDGSCIQYADLEMMTTANERSKWTEIQKGRFMGSLCDAACMALTPPHSQQWYISLGSMSGEGVLAWPVEAVYRARSWSSFGQSWMAMLRSCACAVVGLGRLCTTFGQAPCLRLCRGMFGHRTPWMMHRFECWSTTSPRLCGRLQPGQPSGRSASRTWASSLGILELRRTKTTTCGCDCGA